MIPIKPFLSLLSPKAERARLSVLIFHRVQPSQDALFPREVDARQFEQILGWVGRWCNVLPLDQAVTRLKANSLPARAAAITFDDGYADNHDVALPILQRHGLSATFFIATSFLDGGRMWNDTVIEAVRRCPHDSLDLRSVEGLRDATSARWTLDAPAARAAAIRAILGRIKYESPKQRQRLADEVAQRAGATLPTDMMMRSEQVLALHRAGMQIGAHTHTHPILAHLDAPSARDEILRSKTTLEGLLSAPVDLFAYPNGLPGQDYSAESVDIVRQLGFSAAVSTAVGAADSRADPLQLPRFTPWDRTRTRFGLRLAANLMAARRTAQ
jgi:peptidoglycan/xylan/chitin deacetylase (PgdA/CDA1 family)